MGQAAGGFAQMGAQRAGNVGGAMIGNLSLDAQERAVKTQGRQSNLEARQIELQATQRESDRKARLAKALASQNAMGGTKGIQQFMGSPLKIMEEDMRAESTATQRDTFETQLAAFTKRASARMNDTAFKGVKEAGRAQNFLSGFF